MKKMKGNVSIRRAEKNDLTRLVEIENICFKIDILSRRSFSHFVQPGAHDLLIVLVKDKAGEQIAGYVLVLYRTGTSLARLYSIAVDPQHQGKGIARVLMDTAEEIARERHCALMRLEVQVENIRAIRLYEKYAYRDIGRIANYYEDGSDALRMEKRIYTGTKHKDKTTPYYQQTTDFSCGPAALMMAMKTLNQEYEMGLHEELQIWREATTIFMTSGHGGCSPHGLALSAWQRGFQVKVYINKPGPPFIDGVRDPNKKAVIERVHEDFMEQIRNTDIDLYVEDISPEELRQILRSGRAIITLISTWRLNRNKAPHWVFIAEADEHFIYINDPDITDKKWQSEIDYIQVPIGIEEFIKMACFGQTRLRSFLILENQAGRRPKKNRSKTSG